MNKRMRVSLRVAFVTLCLASTTLSGPLFPLKISKNGRYLEDSRGTPFFYHADAGWFLLNRLNYEEAVEYMTVRKSQGFNALQLQLCDVRGPNREGHLPFKDYDFSQPNPAFYNFSEKIFQKAHDMGLQLVVTPLWLGCCRGDWGGTNTDGTPRYIKKNGAFKIREFGRYLGRRFNRFQNVIWTMGGDANPDNDREEVRQLALGLKETAPTHLITYHAAATYSSMDAWGPQERWLDVVMTYTYYGGKMNTWTTNHPEVYAVSHKEYNRFPAPKPFFLGESQYEGGSGNDNGSAFHARRQAYWSILGGGAGHCYGSPVYAFREGWRGRLSLPGALQMKHVINLFTSYDWHRLVPDLEGQIVIEGAGQYGSPLFVTSAYTNDNRLALAYIPPGSSPGRRIVINLQRFKTGANAYWFDPTNGRRIALGNKVTGLKEVMTPHYNSANETDFLLLLEASR
jgi:hypothetical protein